MSVKNIFITGAEGKIGTFLVKALSEERRYTLSLLSRANVDSDSGSVLVRHVKGDLCQAESYSSYLNGIDVVLHLGGVTHSNAGSKYYSVNSDATLHLIKACEQTGVKRLIFLSSRTASKEGGDYSYSKLIAEKYVQESSLNWLIFRLSEVY
ncbi:MAG: NAD(P)-dependent oxidoreductase, partial [Candidatus Omnitrophica bacterium]|nr:NAD(P)-dependent oxidoreductase [Candidatus Omnitrophota bacterium]